MKLGHLKRRVERREQLVEGRVEQTRCDYRDLRRQWREAWTPTRILVAGLLGGFVAGRSEPKRALRRVTRLSKSLGDPRWLQLIGSLSALLTSIQSTVTALTARHAAKTTDDVAEKTAGDTAEATRGASADDADATHAGAAGAQAKSGSAAAGDAAPASAEPEAVPPSDRRKPDQRWETQPAPAEASTEISER